MKSKPESGDTPTRRVWLCEDRHGSVVGAVYVHVLRTLARQHEIEARKWGHTDTPCLVMLGSTWVSGGGPLRPRSANTGLRYLSFHENTSLYRSLAFLHSICGLSRGKGLETAKVDFTWKAWDPLLREKSHIMFFCKTRTKEVLWVSVER